MNKTFIPLVLLLTGLVISGSGNAEQCELDNPALQSMPAGQVTITRTDGSVLELGVKMATDATSRAAGFQRVCEATIVEKPILFVFPVAVVPNFHMNNVVAPIDIAFVRENGTVDSFHAMKPYVVMSTNRPRYSPTGAVIAALEVHEGFFAKHHINEQARLSWKFTDQE